MMAETKNTVKIREIDGDCPHCLGTGRKKVFLVEFDDLPPDEVVKAVEKLREKWHREQAKKA